MQGEASRDEKRRAAKREREKRRRARLRETRRARKASVSPDPSARQNDAPLGASVNEKEQAERETGPAMPVTPGGQLIPAMSAVQNDGADSSPWMKVQRDKRKNGGDTNKEARSATTTNGRPVAARSSVGGGDKVRSASAEGRPAIIARRQTPMLPDEAKHPDGGARQPLLRESARPQNNQSFFFDATSMPA